MQDSEKVLVTGATGLVGSHLLYTLLQQGTSIKALFRDEKQIEVCLNTISFYGQTAIDAFKRIEWIKGDITDYYAFLDALSDVTHVYHCAAMVSFDPRERDKMILINEVGTSNVANACLERGVKKLCYVSTIGTLGKSIVGELIDEDSAWQNDHSHSAYSLSKFKAEMEVWRVSKEGLNVVVVNPAVILGPGPIDRSSGAIFGKVLKGLKYYTKGATGFVDVRDVATIMVKLMNSPIEGERYVLVSENISYLQIFTKIANALKVTPPYKEATKLLTSIAWRLDKLLYYTIRKKISFTRENARTSHNVSYYSANKVIKELNYSFIPIEQTVRETVVWIKNQ